MKITKKILLLLMCFMIISAVAIAEAPLSKTLTVDIEGEETQFEATRFDSILGYSIYVDNKFLQIPEVNAESSVANWEKDEFISQPDVIDFKLSVYISGMNREDTRKSIKDTLEGESFTVSDVSCNDMFEGFGPDSVFGIFANNEANNTSKEYYSVSTEYGVFVFEYEYSPEAGEGISPRIIAMIKTFYFTNGINAL